MKGYTKNKKTIKLRLECFDSFMTQIRKQIEMGYSIPDMKILIQPK